MRYITLFCTLLCTSLGNSQITISGALKNAEGTPIKGAQVWVVGSLNSAITDAQGRYSLEVQQWDVVQFPMSWGKYFFVEKATPKQRIDLPADKAKLRKDDIEGIVVRVDFSLDGQPYAKKDFLAYQAQGQVYCYCLVIGTGKAPHLSTYLKGPYHYLVDAYTQQGWAVYSKYKSDSDKKEYTLLLKPDASTLKLK